MLVLSHVSQTVSSHASLYAQLYLIFEYNSSILSRNDCALPKAIAEGVGVVRWASRCLSSNATSTGPRAISCSTYLLSEDVVKKWGREKSSGNSGF